MGMGVLRLLDGEINDGARVMKRMMMTHNVVTNVYKYLYRVMRDVTQEYFNY